MLSTDKKKELFATFGGSEKNTGSAESQVALFTTRITEMTKHLQKNKKDVNTEKSLVRLVGKRRSMLDYLKDNDIERYRAIIKKLELRK
ncbi:MAG: 30S ribosomal protein S15 [Bacteroidia bacterium]|jgi:small subunit ribosomal protein S15|nr:30S ribosomal protein S15 [Bacteroidia bacterium]